jgi:hypothetical protein
MLIGNGVRLSASNPMRQMGLNTAATINRAGWQMTGAMRNIESGWQSVSGQTNAMGIPSGYLHPSCWMMPQKGGALSSRFIMTTTSGTVTGTTNIGQQVTAALTSTTVVAGTAQLIVAITAALSSAITNAGTMTGVANATAALTSGTSVTAALTALGNLVAGITTSDAIAGSMGATGSMTADITSFSELSPENLAIAVWNALIANFQAAGSTGAALSAAGSAGDPWSTALPGAYGAGTAGALVGTTLATQILELFQLAGLEVGSPLTVTATSRDAGDVSQTIADDGTTVTVTRT